MNELQLSEGIGSVNWQNVTQGTQNLVNQPQLKPGNTLSDTLNRINNRITQVSQIATGIKQTSDTIRGRAPQAPPAAIRTQGNSVQLQPQGGTNWKKIAIIAGATVLGGTALYFGVKAFKKKKSLNGLGELNTAKTKSGKVKQRKAVFAKLDEAGKAWPKNKKGVRKPVRRHKSKKRVYKTVKM
ncbi:MAG: hypothetical protein ACK52I_22210 [Pseudomonadota bacterium]|jgi:hypothetical protein